MTTTPAPYAMSYNANTLILLILSDFKIYFMWVVAEYILSSWKGVRGQNTFEKVVRKDQQHLENIQVADYFETEALQKYIIRQLFKQSMDLMVSYI